MINSSGNYANYEYTLTDHLGNSRVSFDRAHGGSTAVQADEYYPFGLDIQSISASPPNKYLYNRGAEWQNDYADLPDLQQTFYRNYDAALGRWVSVDPQAESAESLTPYQYAGNNSVMGNDPLGDLSQVQWDFILDQFDNGIKGNYYLDSGGGDYTSNGTYCGGCTMMTNSEAFEAGANYVNSYNGWGQNGSPASYHEAAVAYNAGIVGGQYEGRAVNVNQMERYVTSTSWYYANGAPTTVNGVSGVGTVMDYGAYYQTGGLCGDTQAIRNGIDGFLNASSTDILSPDNLLSQQNLVWNRVDAGIKRGIIDLGESANKVVPRLARGLGVAAVGASVIISVYNRGGTITAGDVVKSAIGVVSTFGAVGWAYTAIDITTAIVTSTSLTDRIGNAVDELAPNARIKFH